MSEKAESSHNHGANGASFFSDQLISDVFADRQGAESEAEALSGDRRAARVLALMAIAAAYRLPDIQPTLPLDYTKKNE